MGLGPGPGQIGLHDIMFFTLQLQLYLYLYLYFGIRSVLVPVQLKFCLIKLQVRTKDQVSSLEIQ